MRRKSRVRPIEHMPRNLSHSLVEDWGTTLPAAIGAHAAAFDKWVATHPQHTADPVFEFAHMCEFRDHGRPTPRWRAHGYPVDVPDMQRNFAGPRTAPEYADTSGWDSERRRRAGILESLPR